jgi:hypothetical protein
MNRRRRRGRRVQGCEDRSEIVPAQTPFRAGQTRSDGRFGQYEGRRNFFCAKAEKISPTEFSQSGAHIEGFDYEIGTGHTPGTEGRHNHIIV